MQEPIKLIKKKLKPIQKIPSQNFISQVSGVKMGSLRSNIRLLLRMVLKNGYTLNEKVAKKMDMETMKNRKKGMYT